MWQDKWTKTCPLFINSCPNVKEISVLFQYLNVPSRAISNLFCIKEMHYATLQGFG